MQLQELLDHITEDVLQDRASPVSGPSKNLWSDTVVVRYLNQAEQMFARKSYSIVDSTSAICTITLVAGVDTYALDKAVVKVLNARMSSQSLDMGFITHERLQGSIWASSGTDWLYQIAGVSAQPGLPLVWTMGEGTRMIRVYPAPDADTAASNTLKLRVARMPSTPLSLSSLTAEPQIPEEYHLNLCDWVAYRALSHQDVDGNNRKEANAFRAEFMAAVADARVSMKRLMQPDGQVIAQGWGNG